ncbi:serine/threonine-protein kinase prpf4B isoform X2 [Phalaenopsis equestris]|uniref:serine/threonine-protein kinase prpf4B isoform X2 n=1 Tax=Phalaenopsis equestris TaxID=78828 RepID=UPI0009E22686|nr:serine/threonine-protein kinase prpf4B isoform X2 [Phalaenopsis equestris]
MEKSFDYTVDYEREEGEILEEEEDGGGREGPGWAMEVDSEVEPGEIKMNTVAPARKKELSRREDLLQEHHLDNLNAEKNMEILNRCAKENDRGSCYLFDKTLDAANNMGEYGDLARDDERKKSKSLITSPDKENHGIIDLNDFSHQEEYSDCTSKILKSKKRLKQEEDERRGSVGNHRSISRKSSKVRCIEAAQSSSCDVVNNDQSVSDDHKSGGLHEQPRKTDADESIEMSRSERWIKERSYSDHERSSMRSLNKYTSRSQVLDKETCDERESNVHRKNDVHDYRHNSQDRGREGIDRWNGSQDRRNDVNRHSSEYRDNNRKRSRSSSRYDERENKHDCRYKERDRDRESKTSGTRDRERERERKRERERDRFKESERIRNIKGESERDKYSSDRETIQKRDKNTNSFGDRERVDERDRHRRSGHDRQRDSRQSKHDDTKYQKESTRDKTDTINKQDFKEEKRNTLWEEDEDYQGRIEQQLAKQEEEDIEKIKEESRKRTQAILEKYKKQENQQHLEGEEVSMEKDGMQQDMQKINVLSSNEGVVEQQDLSDALFVEPSFTVGKSPVQNGFSVPENIGATCVLGEGSPKGERSADMFCDDIFGESPTGVRKVGKDDFMKIDGNGLHDNWDDAEGYYIYRLGEVLDGRYEVIAAHGKGVFSTVVRAKDLKCGKSDPEEVAIKIIRSNDTMYKAGMEELVILKKLAGADPEDKRHCVRFLSSFKLTAVRAYAKQLFIALKHLRNCGVLHCDIKPDNMLVNEAKNVLKLCDFGNAMFAGKNDITPYLVSRFYRAPEIILGLSYDHPLDIWSVGCCLFELYTGKVLFPGPSNNDMLRLHMELKGPFPKKMLRKGAFIDQHFDQDLNFHATEDDPVTKKTVKRLLLNIKTKDIGSIISGSPGEDPKMLANFKDLLERVFILDPEKRMTVSQALSHPFITGK